MLAQMVKMVDIQDLPDELQKEYFELRDGYSNDCFLEEDMVDLEYRPVFKWIVDNYENIEKDDRILIKYWW